MNLNESTFGKPVCKWNPIFTRQKLTESQWNKIIKALERKLS